MKTIICGAGEIGYSIADKLSNENFEVTVIDESFERLNKISENLDVKVINDVPSLPSVLTNAGANDCEIIIAVTKSDEMNMITCQIGHSLFNIPKKIARIRQQDYLKGEWQNLYTKNNLPIDAIISPENEVAKAIHRRIISPGTIDMVELSEKRLKLIGFKCENKCNHLGLTVRELSEKFPDYLANILFIFRKDKKFVVNSSTIIESEDLIYMVVDPNHLSDVLKEFGHEEIQAKKIVIIGGGNIGFSLAQLIENGNGNIVTELIESNKLRAEYLASNLNKVTVTHGDGLENHILDEVNIANAGFCISITEDDEVNILSSLLAKRSGSTHTVALINQPAFFPLVNSLEMEAVVSPPVITVSSILQFIRKGQVEAVHSIIEEFGEVISVEALETSPIIGQPLKEIKLPKDVSIGAIVKKDNKIYPPRGNTIIDPADKLVIFVPVKSIKKVQDLLSVRLDYY